MADIAGALQYGALGLLALVLVGVAWYVRSVESRNQQRELFSQQEREKRLEVWIGLVKALTLLNEKLDVHAQQSDARLASIESGLDELLRKMAE